MSATGRRSSGDAKWAAVKADVLKRDSGRCRLLRILSARDALLLKRNAGERLQKIDPAHIYPVSKNIPLTYNPANLISLNRYSHDMLDTSRHPVTGESISRDEVYDWWKRIAGESQWNMLQSALAAVEDM